MKYYGWRCALIFLFHSISQAGKETDDIGALQRAEDFVKAFILGFEVDVSTCY